MFNSLTEQWHGLKRGTPGHRFQSSHAAARHRKIPWWHRLFRFGLALVSILVGAFFAVMPGPAVIFFAIAGALLATESRRLAVALDWSEVKLRALIHWAKRHWRQLGLVGRIAVVAVGVMASASMTALSLWMVFRR
ncbi:MAG: hypothetical protein JWM35_1558 [Verrucomicrobia bacterium]|nr:hypothetical protein [Verrucomicrobiota bacterium]